ncbi:hypothetical protein JX265_003284 [Neoarthrinium moseri]|uniref:Nephrocystin 3-like N-terminal domain-containing protein n=1 Tax=Neoarthrinium moseri TaxID=1658444 RepID=A0A9P9WTJ7_9PEZI|nr:hypothetical protein JX265_003284 [Neoarthrinium moseri]
MEPPPKRRRVDESLANSEDRRSGDASRGAFPSQLSSIFDGTGISNSHGEFHVGRDVFVTNNNIHSPSITPTDTRRTLLESLRFDQIDARRQSIKTAHSNTCRWFLQTDTFKKWEENSQDDNFLWIKGKPGAGKSTLMKFLLSEISKRVRRRGKNEAMISFFFNARGHELEKSTAGLYRSLVLQLLDMKPESQHILDQFRPGHQWTIDSLKFVLEEAMKDLEEAPIICLIDALDECDEDQVRDMVLFLESLVNIHGLLHVCFASRHYPRITIQTRLSIVLEERDGHYQDITTYLSSALRIGHSKGAEDIRFKLQEKARGVFMWVVLVVGILNKDYDTGDVHKLAHRIQELPGDLHSLFRDILTRDTKNREGLLLCIQWILFSKQPLTPKQLYLAILSGLEPEYLSNCHSDDYWEGTATRYILDKSKGLAEVTRSKTPTIQFIHESVNDFLYKENGLVGLFPELGPNVKGRSHEALQACCLKYMTMEAVHTIEQSSEELSHGGVTREFPLLEYANSGILYHAEQAGSHGINQEHFLATFPRSEWVRQHNVLQKFAIRRYTPTVSLLYILAEAGLPILIRAHSARQSCFEVEDERYGVPILAAMAMKQGPTMLALLELQAARVPEFDFQDFCSRFPPRIEDLNASRLGFKFSQKRGLIHQLVEYGCDFASMFFVATEAPDSILMGREGSDLLNLALKHERYEVVKLLFKHNSYVPTTDPEGRAPLHRVSSTAVAKLLIDRGSNIEATDRWGQTPLHTASAESRVEIATLLINSGANVAATDNDGVTPLHEASFHRSDAVARLLIDNGSSVLAIRNNGETPLHTASRNGSDAVARLLLDSGAILSVIDEDGETPLHKACWYESDAVARLLIDSGANVAATDNNGRTLLHEACWRQSAAMARLLIDSGANVAATDNDGRTPLHEACWHESDTVARLLIDSGANVAATDNNGRTPLHKASLYGSDTLARLLIDNGANVSAISNDGETPLDMAFLNGRVEIVSLLLEHGANLSVANKDDNTPLLVASSSEQVDIVNLLRKHSGTGVTNSNR